MSNDHLKFYDKEDRASALPRLFAGAIVGHTTTNTARIWVRAHTPGDYYLIVSTNPLPESGQPYDIHGQQLRVEDSTGLTTVSGELHEISLKYSTDVTGVIDLDNLKAGTRYYYGLFSLLKKRSERWEVGRDAQLSFCTQPADVERCVFGFYSCHMPFKGGNAYNMDMWSMFADVLEDNDSDFLIGGGDQVYTDGDKSIDIWRWLVKHLKEVAQLSDSKQRDVMLSWYRDIYRSYWGANSTKQVYRSYPNYMIWDDHEIMDGWGSYTDAELADKLDTIFQWQNTATNLTLARNMFYCARQVYYEYQHSHNPHTPFGPKAEDCQWDYTFRWGPLSFFVMDMRGHRRYDPAQKANPAYNPVLGDDQWARLTSWLSAPDNNEDAFFLVSPVPVIHANDYIVNVADINALGLADDLRDEWDHYSNQHERNRLLKECFILSQNTGKPVVFLSGDVHVGASFSLFCRQYPGARLYQITSSAITYAKTPGGLLKLIVKNRGKLSNSDLDIDYERLGDVFPGRNFSLMKYQKVNGKSQLFWDLYGKSGEIDNAVIKLKRVHILYP